MNNLIDLVKELFPKLDQRSTSEEFRNVGVDSFDLMVFRTKLEQKIGKTIPDLAWVSFRNFNDIQEYIQDDTETSVRKSNNGEPVGRSLRINMPQMNVGGLSESWLFKELGDLHWSHLSKAFGRNSNAITDELGNRLYATFVRIQFESTGHLGKVAENDTCKFTNEMVRFGKNMFFGKQDILSDSINIRAKLLTSFSQRGSGNNKDLLRADPHVPSSLPIEEVLEIPVFAKQYADVKNQKTLEIMLAEKNLRIEEKVLFETEHFINPYYEINGVNLLYFAAYPLIHETYERIFINANRLKYSVKTDWALEASTVAKDIFYFGNCDIDDSIIFKLNSFKIGDDRCAQSTSSLYRKSDGKLLARIFNIKAIHS